MTSKTKNWGFNPKDADKATSPQNDFFHHINGSWIKENAIPDSESRWGAFMVLRLETEKQLKTILEDLKKKKAGKGTNEQMIRDLFHSGMDMKKRNTLGASPLAPLRTHIEKVTTKTELSSLLAFLHKNGVGVFFDPSVDQNLFNTDHYTLYLSQDGLGMPDRDYYIKNDPESKRIRNAYQAHIATMITLAGKSKKEADEAVKEIMRIETALAKASTPKADLRDPKKNNFPRTLTALSKEFPTLNWNQYFKTLGAPNGFSKLVIGKPNFLKEVSRILQKEQLDSIKTYLDWHALSGFASLLSEQFINEQFNFYGKILSGNKELKPLWRRAMGVVNGALGEALGKLYVEKHFPTSSKKKMDTLVSDLFAVYRDRIKALDWMGPATKKRALRKLGTMKRKIGYPSKWKSYKGLSITPDDFIGNILEAGAREHKRQMQRIGKRIDRSEWFMNPQTVNAYYAPLMNEIVFPAAILQHPFFDPKNDDAINYGGIGTVIGHEITHGFDDQGSEFDEKGNLKTWWTKEDKKRFTKKAQGLVKQFNTYKVAGAQVNGKLTLGENIADLGGLVIAYEALMRHLKKTGRKTIDGYTPEQRFFIGYAQTEREHAREAYQKMIVKLDPHSPSQFRINGPASNSTEFYEAFGVHKKHKLFRSPKDRIKIW